jgi:uncharacterized protein (DUF1015 family)
MTKIRPLKAIIYNQEKVKDLSKVVCPPYDVISPSRQEYFNKLDEHNLIHILLAKDSPQEDKYRRSAKYFQDWLKEKILIQEDKPGIYFYSQQYKIRGEKKTRLGFICLLQLDPVRSSVFGHENTRVAPKEDRLKLVREVKANLSPIFVVFGDKKRIIQRIFNQELADKKPFVDIVDDENIQHKLWRVDNPQILKDIQEGMESEKAFIADGHHRYEVGCIYRDEMKEKLGKITGEEPFNYVLSYFTDVHSRDLTIFPIHRLVRLEHNPDMNSFLKKLQEYFYVEEVKDKARFFFLMEKAGQSEHVLGMYKDKRYWLLRLKNVKILDNIIKDKPVDYRSLDVSILNYVVLQIALGVDSADKGHIDFSSDAEEFMEKVDNQPNHIAFFLNPVKIDQIVSIALSGEKMPPKSTYFYPKVLSGLLINPLTG